MSPESSSLETGMSSRSLAFLAWLEVNKSRLILGAVVLAVLVSGFVIHRWRVTEREKAASSALIQAQRLMSARANVEGPDPEVYLRIASDYRGTDGGARAILFAAEALFLEGRYSESLEWFQEYRAVRPLSPWAGVAAYGVAASLDAMGKRAEAFQAYQEVLSRHGSEAVASQARLAMAGLYVLEGEPRQALQLYDELRVTAWAEAAMLRRDQLLMAHPELEELESRVGIQDMMLPTTGPAVEQPILDLPDAVIPGLELPGVELPGLQLPAVEEPGLDVAEPQQP